MFPSSKVTSPIILCATLGVLATFSLPLSARTIRNIKPKLVARQITFTPSQKPKPKRTTAGASRNLGYCPQDAAATPQKLRLLIPQNSVALTLDAHPTLLAYIPQTSGQNVFLAVTRERDGAHMHHATLPIQQPGIMAIPLPKTLSPLEIGVRYVWSLSIICETALMPDSPTVEGVVERIQDAGESLNSADPLTQAEKLGKAGIWYDMISQLHQLSTETPDPQIQANFQKILVDAGIILE